MIRSNQLDELQRRLEEFQVYRPEEIEAVLSAGEEAELLRVFVPVVDRFLEMYEPAQEEFRNVLAAFVRLYPLQAQALPAVDPELERLHEFCRLLLTRLPAPPERERSEVAEEVTLAYGWNTDARESDLLRNIRRELPREMADRYRALMEKRRAETLTDAEHADLIRLTDESEQLQAERLASLADLAHLRQTTFARLARDLDFRPHRNA